MENKKNCKYEKLKAIKGDFYHTHNPISIIFFGFGLLLRYHNRKLGQLVDIEIIHKKITAKMNNKMKTFKHNLEMHLLLFR